MIHAYDCEDDEPLESRPPDEPHGRPPDGIRPLEDEERAGQLRAALHSGHRTVHTHHDDS